MKVYREIPKAAREKNKAAFFKNGSSVRKELVQLHCHDGYEILYIRRGSGEQTINGRRMVFCQGDVVIIRPGESHATLASAPKGCDVDVVQFFESFLQDEGECLNVLCSGVLHPRNEDFARAFDMLSDLGRFDLRSKALVREGLIRFVCGLCVQLRLHRGYPVLLPSSADSPAKTQPCGTCQRPEKCDAHRCRRCRTGTGNGI